MDITAIKDRSIAILSLAKDAIVSKAKKIYTAFREPKPAMKCFYLLLVVGILCFAYTWVNNGFTVPLSGDYSLQEMTFLFNGYDDWHYFFRTGQFPQWDRSTFLGIDNIGGNSFYYLFDPFFLILLPFPRDWLLVLQGLEFVPKMVVAGMFFYWYLGSFNLSTKVRTIGALAFAFSGYSMCYLWFHFIDSVAFLPLCFLGVERIIQRKDPRIFLIGFFLVGLTSYFFFVVYMIGLFIYALYRYFQTARERTYEDNAAVLGVGIMSFVVGVMLGLFVLLPGMYVATNMPRVSSSSYLENIFSASSIKERLQAIFGFTSSTRHNQVTPLLNFLFPADDCYYSNLLNVNWYDNLAGSLYATTPILLLFFVSFMDAIKRRKISYLIGLFIACFLIFTPIGFYLFSGFTVAYARYFILPIACMITWCCLTLERRREIPRTYLDVSMIIVSVLYAISCYLIIYEVELIPSHFTGTYWDLKMILIAISAVWLLICYLLMRHFFHKKKFSYVTIGLMSFNIVAMCNATIYGHGLSSISKVSTYDEETKIVSLLKESEGGEDYYRIYNTTATRNNSNVPLREGYSGLSAFHSVYPFNAQDFLDRSRIPHGYHNWSMGIYNRRENLETFLGTKYYIVDRIVKNYKETTYGIPKAYPERTNGGYTVYASDYDIPYGYVDILDLTDEQKKELGVDYSEETLEFLASNECNKSVYVNTNFIDFGFSFDTVMNTAWLATNISSKGDDDDYYYGLYEDYNEYPLLRLAMLDNDDYQTFYKKQKYNAGTINFTDDDAKAVNIEAESTLTKKASKFQSSLTTQIQRITSTNNIKVKTIVYSANWPATENKPSGVYAVCNPNDATDQVCLAEYKNTNPWEYANEIRPGDTVFDYDKPNGNSKSVLYNSKILVTFTDASGNDTTICSDADPDDPSTGYYISINDSDNIEWRLFDENDRLISFARHPYVQYKNAHGYYTDRPVKKILGIVKTGSKDEPVNLSRPSIYVQHNSDYQSAIDELKKYSLNIKKRSETSITFTTNYIKDRFVVLNYPYQQGFTIKEKTTDKNGDTVLKEIELYKAQGGFIGFEALEGEHEYVFSYETPYFKLGYIATSLGLLITGICFAYFGYRKKRYKQEEQLSLGMRCEEFIISERYKYHEFETELPW